MRVTGHPRAAALPAWAVRQDDAGELVPGLDAELAEGVPEVMADGVRRDVEPLGGGAVGGALRDQLDDVALRGGQRIPALAGAGPDGAAAVHAQLTQPGTHAGGVPVRADVV